MTYFTECQKILCWKYFNMHSISHESLKIWIKISNERKIKHAKHFFYIMNVKPSPLDFTYTPNTYNQRLDLCWGYLIIIKITPFQ